MKNCDICECGIVEEIQEPYRGNYWCCGDDDCKIKIDEIIENNKIERMNIQIKKLKIKNKKLKIENKDLKDEIKKLKN